MGWSSGTEIVIDVANAVKKHVPHPNARRAIYKVLVRTAENHDWDCQNEAQGIDPLLDEVLGLNDPDE